MSMVPNVPEFWMYQGKQRFKKKKKGGGGCKLGKCFKKGGRLEPPYEVWVTNIPE